MTTRTVPAIRIRSVNDAPVRPDGDFILYWMTANRRVEWNFSLQRAVEWSVQLGKPLVILESLRVNYRWASDRLHRFVLQGMADHRAACRELPVTYYCYIEPERGAGSGLLEELSRSACVIITDDFPCFFLPGMLKLASRRSHVQLEAVDSNGLLPLRGADRAFPTAYAFRRFLQRELLNHLQQHPEPNPLASLTAPKLSALPANILQRWPEATPEQLTASPEVLLKLPIDHTVTPAAMNGGSVAARQTLARFLQAKLNRYDIERNSLDHSAASGLSPYLHFGHLSVHEIFTRVTRVEEWTPADTMGTASGHREGWWGLSPAAESFFDELITWRELGYNMSSQRSDYDRYESLPDWAQKTLAKHEVDPREYLYSLEELAEARTHDEIWNAAQRELVRDGRMHNYLRMLWGKKILEWTESPRQALAFMIELNNRYAVDGRNPNSYSGIFWVLGRYDRAWGPERAIFGTVRYMSSDSTRRKLKLRDYLLRYGQQ